MLYTFCITVAILSSPIPVSILGFGRGVSLPVLSLSYCMKTRFHNSLHLSQSHFPIPHSGASHRSSSPLSMKISLQGPQGPISPMLQKLSFSPNLTILSAGIPVISCHSLKASLSSLYIVTHSLSLGRLNSSVKNSHANSIASFLK